MPICTSCTHPTPYLYTVYESAHNLRLEQCTACHAFADPYVEHDTLTLLLDLILLKRDVYRHLLFNRGLGARKVEPAGNSRPSPDAHAVRQRDFPSGSRHSVGEQTALARRTEQARWLLILKLGTALIVVDAFIRWAHLSYRISFEGSAALATGARNVLDAIFRVFVGCLVETVAFHAGVICTCYIVLKGLECAQLRRHQHLAQMSGIRQEFRYSHLPLTLLYSSITKLFLLLLLSIWHPPRNSQVGPYTSHPIATIFTHPILMRAFELLDEDRVDREWIIRNVLGGMAAGFGLRVVLDCHPVFTTTIILAGWAMKTAVAGLFAEWIGIVLPQDDGATGQIWLAYSIP
ncbi:Arv1-domain-containing protein [Obba rivulosa]|uniref:Protein ARV n=1 Tax=Obba rivulosa TaxID=1052685 RepID=A0A8E2J4X2_9APHY|nr:Arv1-domain-containing protein [Obba rivulosa]